MFSVQAILLKVLLGVILVAGIALLITAGPLSLCTPAPGVYDGPGKGGLDGAALKITYSRQCVYPANDRVPWFKPGPWRVLPIRSDEERILGRLGGEAEQHCQGIARSLSNPKIIYLSHDCGQFWRSVNGGESWQKTRGEGLHVFAGQSVEVDPLLPNVLLAIVDNSWSWMHDDLNGVYRSTDWGDTWKLTLHAPTDNSRRYEHNVAFDRASVTGGGASRWYTAFYDDDRFTDSWLYRSDDGGKTWALPYTFSGESRIHAVVTHPSDGQTVYVAAPSGLHVSGDRGATFNPLGDLPAGAVSSIAVDPVTPDVIHAVLQGAGLYRSVDGGVTFSLLLGNFPAEYVFMNPGFPDVLYLVPIDAGKNTIITHDGGQTWIEDMVTAPAPGLKRDSSWKSAIEGRMTGIVPNPRDPGEAVAFSRATIWKTTDGGHVFADSSTLFTGYAASWWNRSIGFDPCDPDSFIITCADVGMAITHNRGLSFTRCGVDRYLLPIRWSSQHGTAFFSGQIAVTGAGDGWKKKLVRTDDGGTTWAIVDDNEAPNLFVSFHPAAANLVYAGCRRSFDGGKTFSPIPYLESRNAQIVGFCFSHADTVFAINRSPTDTIFRSDDRGDTWVEYSSPGWTFARHDSKPTFAADPAAPDRIYSIDSAGDAAIFTGNGWKGLGVLALAGDQDPSNYVRSIAVDPIQPDIIYAGMHAAGIETVWRSTDRGTTWESITDNLPRLPATSLNVNPFSGELLFGSVTGTWILPPPYESPHRIYDNAVAVPH
jgi:photosystem II stability/assembly factor-like uncharacterized protein